MRMVLKYLKIYACVAQHEETVVYVVKKLLSVIFTTKKT